jgi:hypothetical protein
MSAQHTPGPWVYRRSFDSSARRDIWTAADATGHRELVATIPDADGDHINADARLIAAAPDLLAALQDFLSATEETYDNRHERQAAIDAIAKAMGGDQ